MEFVQQIAAVGAVLALLGATLWWLRRRGIAGALPGRRTAGRKIAMKRLEHLERLALGPQHTLHLVRLGGRELLLASTPSGCTLISPFRGDLHNHRAADIGDVPEVGA